MENEEIIKMAMYLKENKEENMRGLGKERKGVGETLYL